MPIRRLDSLEQFAAVNLTSDPGYIQQKKQIPLCLEVRIGWALSDGKTANNILHGRYIGPTSPASVALANSLKTSFTTGSTWTALAAFLAPATGPYFVGVRDLNAVDQPEFLSSIATVPGTSSGTALPDETAFVLTLKTAKAGPQNRGRMFIPCWSTTALGTGNVVAPGAVTAAANWGETNIRQGFTTNNLTLCIGQVHRQAYGPGSPPQHPDRPAGTVDVSSVIARDNHWDTQRKRGLK